MIEWWHIFVVYYIYIYIHIVVNIIQPISIIQMEQIQTFDVLILGGPKSGKKRFAERDDIKRWAIDVLKKINTMV